MRRTCRISYRDRDGDGFGTDAETTGRCDGTVPAGYSSIGGDCCDDGGNLSLAAQIHPNQTEYFDAPANICGIAWDYDCNGQTDFGGYTCSSSGDACSNPDMRTPSTETSRGTGCVTSGSACGTAGCESQSVNLVAADCGTDYARIGCACNGCGQNGCTTCGTAGGTSRRFVQCR
jgi:hypothetical protein